MWKDIVEIISKLLDFAKDLSSRKFLVTVLTGTALLVFAYLGIDIPTKILTFIAVVEICYFISNIIDALIYKK